MNINATLFGQLIIAFVMPDWAITWAKEKHKLLY